MLAWKNLSFSDLSLDELYDLMKLRVDIFVVEQNCPYGELDDKDRHPQTRHLLGIDEAGHILAYARVLAPGVSYTAVSIGRVAIVASKRGMGLAPSLVGEAINIANEFWPGQAIKIGAQEYLQDFYRQLGFRPVSDVYLEDGIPHLDMLRQEALT